MRLLRTVFPFLYTEQVRLYALQAKKSKILPAFFVFHFNIYRHELFSLSVYEIQIHKKRPHPVCFGMRSVPVLVEIGHLAGHKALNAHAGRVGDGHKTVFKFNCGVYEIKPFGVVYGMEFNR